MPSKHSPGERQESQDRPLRIGREHLSPIPAHEQDYPPEERPTTPIEEAGERKGDEAGDGGTERRGP